MSARLLYFDCFSGISGDMVLGAFLDAGLPLDELKQALGSLAMPGYDVTAERVLRAGVSATKFNLHEHGGPAADPEISHTADGGHSSHHHAPAHAHPHDQHDDHHD